MAENVKPTRMELINSRQRLVLAEKGHKLLKQKRDALVVELFNSLKKAKDLRSQVNAQIVDSHKRLAIARSIHGDLFVEANALAAHTVPEVSVTTKNIMGLKIPIITAVDVRRNLVERGYSIMGSSAQFDAAVDSFEQSLNAIIQLAETEASLKRLLKEIEKTNRRVNALEFNIQPGLRATIRSIQDHLNRLESERFFALKLTKARLTKAQEAEEEVEGELPEATFTWVEDEDYKSLAGKPAANAKTKDSKTRPTTAKPFKAKPSGKSASKKKR